MITRLHNIATNDYFYNYDYAGCIELDFAINFVSNQDVKIRGISLHGVHPATYGVDTLIGTIQLLDSAEIIVYSQDFIYKTDGSPQYVDQLFTDPPKITANKEYTIILGYDSCYMIWSSENSENPATSTETCGGEPVRLTFSHHLSSQDNIVSEGQIPRIFFAC